jgi:DNA-binding beta-propeller fold protein YncE
MWMSVVAAWVCSVVSFGQPASTVIARGTLVASNMNANTVTIADVATGATVATHTTTAAPHEVAISPDGRRAVVSVYGDRSAVGSSVLLFDLTAPTCAPHVIELGAGNARPHGLAFLPDGRRLLVTAERAQRVLLVGLDTRQIDSSMSSGQAQTHMVATTRDGARAFTTNISAMSVSVVDPATRRVLGVFPVGAVVEGLAVRPDGRDVWVGGNASQTVFVLDATTGAVRHRIGGFGMPYRIGITPDGTRAVVSDPGAERIHIIDAVAHTIRATIDVPPQNGTPASPQGVTMGPDGATAFVTLKGAALVAIVDIAAARIVRTIAVGAGSDGVGYSPISTAR